MRLADKSGWMVLACLIATAAPMCADTIGWADWSGSSSATIALGSGISVAYNGQTTGLLNDYPSWNPVGTFSGGTVSNAPPQAFNAVGLTGGTTQTNTLTFSTPIVDPVLAIWSLGSPGLQASFDFGADEPFTLEAGGPSAEYGGQSITVSGNDVFGAEGNGVIQFDGTFSQLTWTNPTYEDYYAFTVGVAGEAAQTPEPTSFLLLLIGAAGFVLAGVVKRARASYARREINSLTAR